MLNWLKKKKPPEVHPLYQTLFGDLPLEPGQDARTMLAMPGLESRRYLQAWHALRARGAAVPPEKEKELLGVVVEVGLEQGLDAVAAYSDYSARYLNFSGAAIIWDTPEPAMNAHIDALFAAGRQIIDLIGVWDQPRPAPVERGMARINLLAPGGLYFGMGPWPEFAQDRLAAPAFTAAQRLMMALMDKTRT
ncbi:MAG TPA: hypothetical protein VF618_05720 [Thermoanaerobaculia bacterium]